jgi:hypothetical protein
LVEAPGLSRLFVPSLSDLLFVALLLWLLVFTNSGSPTGLLQDAGAGVHIRTGEWILANHAVPVTDPFSFSKPGEPWFAWEWLSDVVFAVLNRVWGLKGLILFAAALLSGVCWLLVRHMVWKGANALAALVVMNAVIGAGSIHFLARPHIFTLLFLGLVFFWIERDRRTPSWTIWLVVPLTAVWANLHGGFTGVVITLGALAAGSVLELNWRAAGRYGSLTAASLAASLVNPYGYHLHVHVVEFLRAEWIRKIVLEFQPPRLDTAAGVYFEILLFLGIAMAGKLAWEKRFAEALLILAWAHASLQSVRHVPIFGLLVGPYIAWEVTLLMRRTNPKSVFAILNQLGDEHRRGLARSSVLVPTLLVLLFAFDLGFKYPADFPDSNFPVEAVHKYDKLVRSSRVFTTDAWGDYLIYRNYPGQRVFFDGRTDYYGEALTQDYETLLNGFPGWEQVMEKYKLDAVLLPPRSALAGFLRARPDWNELETTGEFTILSKLH